MPQGMRRFWILVAAAILAGAALAYQVKVEVREVEQPAPTVATSCQLEEFEEMERELFGKENPTVLDAAKVVIERERGKIEEFVDRYGEICFYAITYNLRNCSVDICARPLARPLVNFVFSYGDRNLSVSINDGLEREYRYRNVTSEEFKLLNAYNLSEYDEHLFIAAESEDSTILHGFGWESVPAFLDGFAAYRGTQVTITYDDEIICTSADDAVIVSLPKMIATPTLVEPARRNLSEEEILRDLLRDEEIRSLAEQKDLLILISEPEPEDELDVLSRWYIT